MQKKKYWFSLDKDKIKLQLKDLGNKFNCRNKRRNFTLIILFFLLLGVGIAIYNNSEEEPFLESDLIIDLSSEEAVSEEENARYSLQYDVLNPVTESNESELLEPRPTVPEVEEPDGEEIEGVITEPLRPVEEIKSQEEISLIKPVSGSIMSGPGWYYHPVLDDWRYQSGVEFSGQAGDIILAVAGGKVISVREDEYLGILLTLEHANGWQTEYGHLSKVTVVEGEVVAKGQEIGRLGTTGLTDGPSLYFALKTSEGPIDPSEYF